MRDERIKRVLVLGSGPIVIGQACEFDYSGTQALKALRDEGIEVVLLNSNPATIMTDADLAHRTYIEPMTAEVAEAIIAKEKPDALLPTMGGQTALNLAKALAENGALARHGVRLIGASLEAINKAEDRASFKQAMQRIGVPLPRSGNARSFAEAERIIAELGYPVVVRPSFTLGGTGGGIARNAAELAAFCEAGLRAGALAGSETNNLLVEESLLGWKEFELEVMRDRNDNAVIICAIENIDPMGVHTGDSMTVAPPMTLTDRELQHLRNMALAVVREIGVESGGCNIQFAVEPSTGRAVVIEMNPRVSRSSALASKATGYPIAKIAAKLAIGYTLDELKNDITGTTTAAFEPSLDYVVVKIPRFDFDKFPGSPRTLGTAMHAVGEVMGIGRTFLEAFGKALRSLEAPEPTYERHPEAVLRALRGGASVEQVVQQTQIDPWFVRALAERVALEHKCKSEPLTAELLLQAKRAGIPDSELGPNAAATRAKLGVRPVVRRVDTCAGEFEAKTPYFYSSYAEHDEAAPSDRRKVLILGSGPNRIGQGIEFDYCCVHAAQALSGAGYETIMVNCNPETVSTDFDTSNRLYFEPLTQEDVIHIIDVEKPAAVIVQLGGQTPLKLAHALGHAPIAGTSPDAIDCSEDRARFSALVTKLGLRQPEHGTALTLDDARGVAQRIGYPLLVRPSYVLGGRAMRIVHEPSAFDAIATEAFAQAAGQPLLIDRFLSDAVEVDLDLLRDKDGHVVVCGVLEHVEEAGVHSGDAACCLPPHTLAPEIVERLKDQAGALAHALGVVGFLNVQFAVQGKTLYVIEANPRASRTVPFIAKATGVAIAKAAALVMVGKTLPELGLHADLDMRDFAVKESVLPFRRFAGADVMLGPEMKSTGEVMGRGRTAAEAFYKAQVASGLNLPRTGTAYLSVTEDDQPAVIDVARRLLRLGFALCAGDSTARYLERKGVATTPLDVLSALEKGEVALLVENTDARALRRRALELSLPYFTTVEAARMAVLGMEARQTSPFSLTALQEASV